MGNGSVASVDKLFCISKSTKVFARLFQKAVGWRGKAPPCGPQTAKSLCFMAQEGRKAVRRTAFRWGTLAGGSPLIYLCMLPDDICFFYKLNGSEIFIFFEISSGNFN